GVGTALVNNKATTSMPISVLIVFFISILLRDHLFCWDLLHLDGSTHFAMERKTRCSIVATFSTAWLFFPISRLLYKDESLSCMNFVRQDRHLYTLLPSVSSCANELGVDYFSGTAWEAGECF